MNHKEISARDYQRSGTRLTVHFPIFPRNTFLFPPAPPPPRSPCLPPFVPGMDLIVTDLFWWRCLGEGRGGSEVPEMTKEGIRNPSVPLMV